jgi:hypothetical protein
MTEDTFIERYGKLLLLVGAAGALAAFVASRAAPAPTLPLYLVFFTVSVGALAFFVGGVGLVRALLASFKPGCSPCGKSRGAASS